MHTLCNFGGGGWGAFACPYNYTLGQETRRAALCPKLRAFPEADMCLVSLFYSRLSHIVVDSFFQLYTKDDYNNTITWKPSSTARIRSKEA